MGDQSAAEMLQEAADGFFLAAEYGRSDVIKALADHGKGRINLGAIIDTKTGRTPLHVAVANGKADALRVLLAAGFPPDLETFEKQEVRGAGSEQKHGDTPRRKRTAYMLAQDLKATDLVFVFHQFIIQQIAGNDVKGVQRMLSAGIDVTMTDGVAENTLVHWAVSCQAIDVLEFLLGCDEVQKQKVFDRRNADGATPLHIACRGNQLECVRALLRNGVDSTIRGNRGSNKSKTAKELATSPAVIAAFEHNVNSDGSKTNGSVSDKEQSREPDIKAQEAMTRYSAGSDKLASKLKLQLEEKDLLINQLKQTIETLVIESQEISKLGEERVMLDYVRKLRQEKEILQRQFEDAEEHIKAQQQQLKELKDQIRELTLAKQAQSPSNMRSESVETSDHVPQNKTIHSETDSTVEADPHSNSTISESAEVAPVILNSSNSVVARTTREHTIAGSSGDAWGLTWSGIWPFGDNMERDADGEVIMTV